MKFINDSPLKYLAFILPTLGAFIMLVLIPGLQWAVDYKVIPVEYHAYITGTVMVILSWIGKKIYQPALHTSPLGFVTVTAGHSNKDPGAVRGKDKEADFVVKVRNAVELYLLRAGLTVKTDGKGSINLPLTNAIQIIHGSSTAIEFHLNASVNPQANGVETISLPKDKALAQKISKAIASVTGSRLRGNNGWIDQSQSARGKLGFVSNGGLVVELGFISNDSEFAILQAKYWLVAKAIADVIIEHEKGLKS
ncbi:N-acetylmuramoyl-L-alanine amidase [Acinetobacter indicus]|uniref:N-acetylmuramoyl-L-alanine amidase n=1 Tax=Acinetobacter indicus TaxID=756892 RepID=UPI00144429D5|nr:N-acetylmuramoyl-L-alanine amidase [Acinetobacter indicus]